MANEALRLIGSGADASTGAAEDELNLRELWRGLKRRKLALLAPMVLITLGVFLWAKQQPPMYTGQALLHVKPREAQVLAIEGVIEELIADPATIESELEFINSPAFIRRVVDKLNPVISNVAGRLTAEQVGKSYVISLGVLTEDPVKAAQIANTLAEEYLVSQVEAKYAAADRATEWLSARIDELRGKVLEAEAKIVEYRTQNHLVNTQSDNPLTLQFFELNTQLALAQAERAEAEARLSRTRGMLDSGGIDTAALVMTSPLMDSLREQETELLRRLADMSSVYGDNHPQMVNTRAEIQSIRDKMLDEVRRIVEQLEDQVSVTAARERELQNNMTRLQGEASRVDLAGVELSALQGEVDTNRQLFQAFLSRFREIVEQQGLQEADAKILSRAEPPNRPSHPRTMLLTVIAFGASVVIGILLVFLIERWDAEYGFRSADEIQAALGVRALALVPDLSRRETQGIAAEDYILQKPNSAYAEALQRVRTNLFLIDGERPPKTVLITSSVPLEGKSTIAASLARQSARSGLKVILIDADLRRPRLHEVIGLPNQNGLSEVLTGRANPESAIKRDEKSGLDFLPAGVGVVSPPDLFRSSTMRILLEETAAYYDLVILDSPPVAAVSDALTLSGMVDKSLYVIRWERTPRNVALAGIRQMLDAGADIAGVVLSRVDVKKHARYGYADSGYYQGRYRKYYVN